MAGAGGALRAFFEGAQEDSAQAIEDVSEKIAQTMGDDAAANVRASVGVHDNVSAANTDLAEGIRPKANVPSEDGAGGSNKIDEALNGGGPATPYKRVPAGEPGGGRFAPKDPDAPPRLHTRGTEYPSEYSKATHDYMNQEYRDEDGNWIDREGLPITDKEGNPISDKDLTYDHVPPVVDHWNRVGRFSSYSDRVAWYNDPAHLQPMSKWDNSSAGGKMNKTYSQDTGPNYTRRGGR